MICALKSFIVPISTSLGRDCQARIRQQGLAGQDWAMSLQQGSIGEETVQPQRRFV
jgi:hypothetical protein